MSHDPSIPAVLAELRTELRGVHAALDRRLDLRIETLDRDRYARFLACTLNVVARVEPTVTSRLGGALPDAATRFSKREALHRDLAALGADVSHDDAPIAIPSTAAALGWAYVLEGSMLGGSVLARIVTSALGAEAPLSYLRFYGAEVGSRWQSFVAALGAHDGDRRALIEAAREGFQAFERAYDEGGLLGGAP